MCRMPLRVSPLPISRAVFPRSTVENVSDAFRAEVSSLSTASICPRGLTLFGRSCEPAPRVGGLRALGSNSRRFSLRGGGGGGCFRVGEKNINLIMSCVGREPPPVDHAVVDSSRASPSGRPPGPRLTHSHIGVFRSSAAITRAQPFCASAPRCPLRDRRVGAWGVEA